MTDKNENKPEEEITYYGDDQLASADAPIETWLKVIYVLLPIWGIVTLFIFWNGSVGWFDRGYWQQLQRAANTTMPYDNFNAE